MDMITLVIGIVIGSVVTEIMDIVILKKVFHVDVIRSLRRAIKERRYIKN